MERDESFLGLDVARELLDECELIYANSWELNVLYPDIEGQTVAFFIAVARLCEGFTMHDLKMIAHFTGVDLNRMEYIVLELITLHEEEPTDRLEDDLVLLSYILPTAEEIAVRDPE